MAKKIILWCIAIWLVVITVLLLCCVGFCLYDLFSQSEGFPLTLLFCST